MDYNYYLNICKDFEHIENYELAVSSEERYVCHHRLETHNSDGERRLVDLTVEELKALDMYFHRPPEELIFMTRSAHSKLHHVGKKFSDEHRLRLSISAKNKPPVSLETRRKLSEKGKRPCLESTKLKISEATKGRKCSELNKIRQSKMFKGKSWKVINGKRVWFSRDNYL